MTDDNALLPRFEKSLREIGTPDPGNPVVVGVSGGADSIALLHLLSRSARRYLLHVVHVNHRIRQAAGGDADFVSQVCAAWGIACHIEVSDVPGIAAADSLSLEEAARMARYRAFAAHAREVGAMAVMVAHHADDQAETLILNLLRGAGLAGLRAMQTVSQLPYDDAGDNQPLALIRPLLNLARHEIENYCRAFALDYRTDETNANQSLLRNRVRHAILPLLEEARPGARRALARSASLLSDDLSIVQDQVALALETVCMQGEDRHQITFDRVRWRALPAALGRAVLREGIAQARGGYTDLSFERVEAAARAAMQKVSGKRIEVGKGVSVYLLAGKIVIRHQDAW